MASGSSPSSPSPSSPPSGAPPSVSPLPSSGDVITGGVGGRGGSAHEIIPKSSVLSLTTELDVLERL